MMSNFNTAPWQFLPYKLCAACFLYDDVIGHDEKVLKYYYDEGKWS